MISEKMLEYLQARQEHVKLKNNFVRLKKRIVNLCDSMEVEATKYSGWYVLLKQDGYGWECLGVYNPHDESGPEEPEWDLCMPIPKPESIEEFQGW